jgi:poly(3-hydroxybutyrate) depolymerase
LPSAWEIPKAEAADPQTAEEKEAAEEKEVAEGTGRVEIKIPEVANKCKAFVPPTYRADQPAALLVYLHATGSGRKDDPLSAFESLAQTYQTIVVCPESTNERAWQATDAEFVRKVIDQMAKDYSIDAARVVVVGRQSGGAIAYLTAFANAEVVRGVVPLEVGIPQRVQVPETDPVNPIYIAISDSAGKPVAAAVEASIKKLGEAKYPVTIIPQLNDIGGWGEAALSPLFVWLDTLDRI